MNDVNKVIFWEKIYLEDDLGWDLGTSTPIFELIANKIKPGKIIILGCGRGHDAVMFAQKGFEVTAIDFSPSAITYLKKIVEEKKVKVNTIQKDLFSLSGKYEKQFDYVLEQTCFCAIDPKRRFEYERLVYSLLKINGRLIGLWFPINKKVTDPGPPFGVEIKQVKEIFNSKSWTIEDEKFSNKTIKSRKGREKLIIFEKV